MKVRCWNTPSLKDQSIGSISDMVKVIKANGDVISSFGPGDTVINGYCLIMGGRESIKETLGNRGSFKSTTGTLDALMARFSTGAFSKTYTVVMLSTIRGNGLFVKGWTPITFSKKLEYTPGMVVPVKRHGQVIGHHQVNDLSGATVKYSDLADAVIGGSGAIMAHTVDVMDEIL